MPKHKMIYLKDNHFLTLRRSFSLELIFLFGCKHDLTCCINACVLEFLESELSVIHSNNNSPI